MKQHSLLKRGYVVVFLLVAIGLFYVACETKKPTAIDTTGQIASIARGQTYSFETIKPELQKLLDYLKSNPQIITRAVLAKAVERHATVADLGLSDKFPGEFLLENGNTFEVYVELFDGSVGAAATIEDAEAYFTLDLDRYPDDAELTDRGSIYTFRAHVAATAHNMGKGLLAKEGSNPQLGLKSTTEKVNYLLFFVGGEERLSSERDEQIYQEMVAKVPGLAKAQQSSETFYLWLTQLYFDADNDWGNEEFELYSAIGTDATVPFEANTNWRFDGGNHTDFSGVSRSFRDVNDRDVLYVFSHPIAIAYGNSIFKRAAIEDDCTAGSHKNAHHGGGKHNHYMYGVDIINGLFSGSFPFWIHDDCSNNDDIYTESMITHPGYSTPECGVFKPKGDEFSDVIYYLRLGTVTQADRNWTGQNDPPPCYTPGQK